MDNAMQLPLVSIVITSFNRAKWIDKAIISALEQDYKNLEIIISDNHSSDDTYTIIEKYLADPRIRFNSNKENIGMLANFKKATEELAAGRFITYVSSDDYLVNNSFISDAVKAFNLYNSLVVYTGVSKNIIFGSAALEHNTAYDYKLQHNFFNTLIKGKAVFTAFQYAHLLNFGGSVFFKEHIIQLDVFRPDNTTYADLQAILLLCLKGDFYFSDKITYVQLFHDNNISAAPASVKQSLVNLNFAELPYEAALTTNFLDADDLQKWYRAILKPFIYAHLVHFLKTNKKEYAEYVNRVAQKFPEVYTSVTGNLKWKLRKIIYNNKFLYFFYNKYNAAKRATK